LEVSQGGRHNAKKINGNLGKGGKNFHGIFIKGKGEVIYYMGRFWGILWGSKKKS